jgi:DNA helicase-2/ATP-dependent DNA helicase PcrA
MTNLNEQQLKIVNSDNDVILVVACPGSGKTHTLLAKYLHVIKTIKPEECILITFTKKAGMEMQKRLPIDKLPFHVGSLHSLSHKILNNNNNIIIMDENDSKNIIYELVDKSNIDNKKLIKNKIISIFDLSMTIYPINIKKIVKQYNLELYLDNIIEIYKNYEKIKFEENLIDFNDLMINLYKYLYNSKSKDLKKQIKYIFFDEYQDVNKIQNDILLKFSETSKLFLVGDDAQSIYSFRGSSVKFILNFEQIFNNKNKQIFLLEDNYRSTNRIVKFCQNIINNNYNKINKNVISNNKSDIKPYINKFMNKHEQYTWIVNDIQNKINNGFQYNDIVILSRKNNLLNEIELYLISNNISNIKNMSDSLLNKEHIKEFIYYIITIINPKSTFYLNKISNLKNIDTIKNTSDLPIIINYFNVLWNDANKSKDLKLLLKNIDNNLINLYEYIKKLYLENDIKNENIDSLYLTTIHGSKGLEWKVVYLIDVNINDFPLIRTKYYLNEIDDMDEERRLLYVACSRAKEYLYITCYNPSHFLKEINSNYYILNTNLNIIKNNNNTLYSIINNYLLSNGYKYILLDIINLNIKKIKTDKYNLLNIYDNLNIILKNKNIIIKNKNIILTYKNISINIDALFDNYCFYIMKEDILNIHLICKLLLIVFILSHNNEYIKYLIVYNSNKNIIYKINLNNINIKTFGELFYN